MNLSGLAYEIGAVFLLAALLMFSTMHGLVPKFLQDGKVVAALLGLALLGYAVYRLGPEFYRSMAPTPTVVRSDEPNPSTPVRKPSQPTRKPKPNPVWQTIIVQEAPPAQLAVPSAPEPVGPDSKPEKSTLPDPKHEGRAKRAVKSVGRFLHLTHKQADPPIDH